MASPIRVTQPAVAQRDISLVVGLDNQIRSLQQTRDRHYADMLHRLISGCSIEPGEHCIQLVESGGGATLIYRLSIDGKEIL